MPTLAELPPPTCQQGWPWTDAPTPDLAPDMTWPLVSIVTPSFQQAAFLEEALRSVLLQGYPNLEVIVMDGGSRDGSVEIIQRYAPWLTHWVSAPDHGQTDAINQGFRRARGEFVGWLNSDDLLLPGALIRAVTTLLAHPHAVLVHGNCDYIDSAGRKVKSSTGRIEAQPPLSTLLGRGGVIRQPTVLLRHSALRQVGYLDGSLHYGMDYDLWIRLRQVGDFVFLADAPLALFRLQPQAKTHALPLAMIGEIYSIAQRHGGDGVAAARRPSGLRWEALARGRPAEWPACFAAELADPAFAALPGPLTRAVQPFVTELLLSQGLRLADQQPDQAAACLRWAVRRQPRLLANRGVRSILLQALLRRAFGPALIARWRAGRFSAGPPGRFSAGPPGRQHSQPTDPRGEQS